MAYFVTEPQIVNEGQDVNPEAIVTSLNAQLENWNGRGSGFAIDSIRRFVISVVRYRPFHGCNSSFISTPVFIERNKCTVNVKNNNELCFKWAVLSALYPAETNKNNVYSYSKYRGVLNLEGLKFPLQVKDIPKFEKLNPNIAVNVLYWEADGSDQQQRSEFTIEYVSTEREREKQINLLLLEDVMLSKRHYVWISNMSRLIAGRTKHGHKSFVCNSCLHPFSHQHVLDNHIPFCIKHPHNRLFTPTPTIANLNSPTRKSSTRSRSSS